MLWFGEQQKELYRFGHVDSCDKKTIYFDQDEKIIGFKYQFHSDYVGEAIF